MDQPNSPPSPYDSNVVQPANTEAYVASDGVIFVCNIKSREFITCFKAVNYQESKEEEEAYMDIHETMSLPSKDEPPSQSPPTQGSQRAVWKHWGGLDDFYRLSQAVKNGQLSERNSKRLEELLGKFHVIKAAMRIIENKRGRFRVFSPAGAQKLSSNLGKAFMWKAFLKKREKNCIIEWICKYLQSCNSTWWPWL